MKLKNILFSLAAIVLSFFAVTAKAETTAPSYYELDGSNLHKIDVSYYLSNSTINMEFKKTTDGQIVYCTERSKTFYTGRAKYYLIGEMDQRIVYLFQNGYPNKTIFGNADKDYLTTGLAVWYLINPNDYSFQHFDLEKGTYRGKDSDIVREMAKLVNGANNYKQAEPTIKLNGNTNLTLSSDGKYYVSSNLGITTTGNVKDSYTVSLEGAPSGTIITNVNGKEQNTFSKNEKFIVKVPVSSIKGTTLNFKVNATAEGGIAKVYEYKPSDSRYQGTSGLYYDYKNINTSLELKLNIVTEVQISKIDATTNKELPGAHLVVKDANGKVIDEWISTEEVHVIKGLNPGKYTLTETIAPEGYVLSTETITFEVKNDGTVTKVVMKNYLEDKPIPVSISKRDITTGEELPGAHLELKDETGEVIYAWVSTNEPFIIKDGLKPGKYTLSEMIAPEGYELSTETVTFVVKEDGTVDGKAIFNSIGNAIKSKITNETEIVTTNPIEYKLDNKTKVKDALGLKAKEISSRVVISSVPKKNVYSVVNILENLGIEVIDICFSSIGNYYAIKTPELDSKVVAMVDIGEEKTNVAILNKGVMIKESILPFGGNVLDDEIAFNYKTKDADSRKIKEEFAVVNRKYADVDENYKCINRINQEVIINQYRLAEILEKKAVEMLKSIKNEINNLTKREIGYIIITGGITTMQGFNTIVEELFVRNATVMNLGIIGIRNNKYACSYGVIKYFVEKLDLREKKYTMYGDEKIEEIMSTRKKIGATGVLGKVFDKIFD